MKLSRYGYANLFLMIALTAGCSSSSELAPTDTDPDSRLEVRGGYVFLEGDINLGPANDGAGKRMQSAGLFDRTRRFQGTSVQFPTYSGGPWTDGIVPWRFDGSVSAGKQADFRAAVAHYHQHTSIQWVEVGNTYSGDHVLVKGDDTSDLGCWSYLGKHGTGAQELQVGRPSNCAFGNMIHEMGHTLGFIHEHQRPDRDSFVTVNKTGENYDKETNASVSLFGNYDMSSIMHYCQDITVKGGGALPCNRSALTQQDIIGIQVMYGSEFEPTADVTSWGPDRLDILFRGTDGQVMKTAGSDPNWEQNLALGGSVVGSPNGVSWGPNRYDIFARGQSRPQPPLPPPRPVLCEYWIERDSQAVPLVELGVTPQRPLDFHLQFLFSSVPAGSTGASRP